MKPTQKQIPTHANSSKQIETGPKRFYVSVQFVCLRRPAQASNHMFIMSEMLAWLPAFVDRKLGLTSRDFNGFHNYAYRNIPKMSVATTSNDEMQPESGRRLHQFQDYLLPSA